MKFRIIILTIIFSIFLFLNVVFADNVEINTEALNARASIWGKVEKVLKKGETYKVLSSQNDSKNNKWYKIKVDLKELWVHSAYVKLIKSNTDKIIVKYSGLRVREKPTSLSLELGRLKKGESFELLDQNSSWVKIKYKQKNAWVAKSYVTVVKASETTITDSYVIINYNSLQLRLAPTSSSTSAGSLLKNQIFELVKVSGDWVQIKSNSNNYWVAKNYVTIKKKKDLDFSQHVAVINYNFLRLREKPSSKSKSLGSAMKNQRYDLLDIKGDWAKIKNNSNIYWVAKNYISIEKKKTIATTSWHIVVNYNSLNIRNSITKGNVVIAKANKGDKFNVLSLKGDWFKINYKGREAWVNKKYVTAFNSPQKPIALLEVKYGPLNAREKPNISSKVIERLSKNSKYSVYEDSKGWVKIKVNNKFLWVVKAYTRIINSNSTDNTKIIRVTETGLRVRKEPNYVSYTLGYLTKGDTFRYKKLQGDWYQITYKGQLGWINKAYTVEVKDEPMSLRLEYDKKAYSNLENVVKVSHKGFIKPEFSFILKKGSTIIKSTSYSPDRVFKFKTSHSGDFSLEVRAREKDDHLRKFSYKENIKIYKPYLTDTGIVLSSTSYIRGIPLQIVLTTTDSLEALYKLYIDSGSGYKLVRNYSKDNTYVWNINKTGRYKIKVEAKSIYSNKSVDVKEEIVVDITGKRTRHDFSTINYDLTALEFSKRQVGRAVTWRNGWVNASVDEVLKELDPMNFISFGKTSEEGEKEVVVATNGLNLRKEPSTESEIIKVLKRGERYPYISESGRWVKINYNSKHYYLAKEYVNIISKSTTDSKAHDHIIVTSLKANVKEKASDSSATIKVVEKSEIYPVLKMSGNWLQIDVIGKIGWVKSNQVAVSDGVNHKMYQFLNLRGSTNIGTDMLNSVLRNKGILSGKGSSFSIASKRHNINEIYLIAHAFLETGNGRSELANGGIVNGVKVYNMYGIGAYDSDPIKKGFEYAYKRGWTTPEKAIIDGAKWISDNYVNNSNNQNTLYKMKWNYNNPAHQYATDIGWARKQTYSISSLYEKIYGYKLKFEIPSYKK